LLSLEFFTSLTVTVAAATLRSLSITVRVCCEGKQKQTKKQRKGLKIQEELKKASVKRRQEDLKKAAAQKEKVKIKERNTLKRNRDLGQRLQIYTPN
jgi:hypothetical protein